MSKLQESLNDFYVEFETSYIDGNTHGVIVELIGRLQSDGLLDNDEVDFTTLGTIDDDE